MSKIAILKKAVAVTAAACMTFSLAACGGTSGQNATTSQGDSSTSASSTTTANAEPVTINCVVNAPASEELNTDNAVIREIEKQTGVKFKVTSVDDNKYNVILASGDLPDMIRAKDSLMRQLIVGGNVIPMDDLIPTHGQNLQKIIPKVLEFSRKFWSNGTNKIYFIAPQVQLERDSSVGQSMSQGFIARWDWYKELGYPEVKSIDDMINILAQMVKNHPKTTDGKPVYGLGGWSDWGIWSYMHPVDFFTGYCNSSSDLMELNIVSGELVNIITDENAPYWQSINYYYKAQKLGLLDPDFFTMKNEDFATKVQNGQYASLPANWWSLANSNENSTEGFMSIPVTGGAYWLGGNPSDHGWSDSCYGITKNCKNPEKAMDLINYLWSYEGSRLMYSGVKGEHWDMADNKPQLKDSTVNLNKNTESPEWKSTGIQLLGENFTGLSGSVINPDDGKPLNLFETSDMYIKRNTALDKDYSQHYSVEYPGQIFEKLIKDGTIKDMRNLGETGTMDPNLPDDVKRAEANLKNLAITSAARLILAKSDSEFEKIKQDTLKKFKAADVQKVTDWYVTADKKARAEVQKLN